MSTVYLDPKIWGPHYWFFIHTVAMTYPIRPNAVTKKKYYEFIQNLPLFIPVENISGEFSKLIDKFHTLPQLLYLARTDKDFYLRRHGFKYFKYEFLFNTSIRKKIKR